MILNNPIYINILNKISKVKQKRIEQFLEKIKLNENIFNIITIFKIYSNLY